MSRPRRLPAFGYTGYHQYFLTICTFERRPLFSDAACVRLALDQFLYISQKESVELTAYCFMPDHVHALATGVSETSDLRRFTATSKQRAGFRYKCATRHPLWQEGYYEHVLRDDEDPIDVIAYIVNNPVRAKLVQTPEDYPHWGSSRHTREEILEAIQGRGGCRG